MELVELNKITDKLESGSREKGGSIDSGIISIGGTHLSTAGGFKWSKKEFISEYFYSKMRNGKVQKNDILIVKDGATTGKTSFVGDDFPFNDAAINEHVFRLQINNERANPKYVFYFLYSPIGQKQILDDFRGATVGGISRGFLDLVRIPLPDLETQNKIVAILDKAKAILDKREKTINQYDKLLRAVFLDMFGDPITNSKGWAVEDLKAVAKLERGKFSPRPRNDPSFFNGIYPFIQTGDIASSEHRLTRYSQTLNDRGEAVSKKFNAGDIVIAIVGATIGATSILEIDVYATDSVIGIKVNNTYLNNTYLEMLLRFHKQILIDSAPEAARANINLEILGNVRCIIPSMHLQDRYSNLANCIYAIKHKLTKSRAKLDDLLKSLSQQLFSERIIFDIDAELNALINVIDLKQEDEENKINSIKNDITFLQRLTDRLSGQEFENKVQYDKAKYILFRIMNEEDNLVKQVFRNSNTELTL